MDAVHFVRVLGAPDMLQTSAFVSLLMTLVSAACGDSQDLPDEREIARRTLELCQGAATLILEKQFCGSLEAEEAATTTTPLQEELAPEPEPPQQQEAEEAAHPWWAVTELTAEGNAAAESDKGRAGAGDECCRRGVG